MQTQSEIQGRIERYGQLRGALRAIESSSANAGAFGLDGAFQQVRSCLLAARSASQGSASDAQETASAAEPAMLDNVDRMLDELQRSIVELVGTISLSQLRATLPAIKRQHPESLTALLDVCLNAHPSGSGWSNLVDYLITLLASEEQDARRVVARDPVSVTPLLQKLCATYDRDKSEASEALAQMFREAGVDVERGVPSGPIIERMRAAKHQAMQTLLIPDLLRAITTYNVAVSNQRSELVETERALEEAELEAFEESLGAPAAGPTATPSPRVEPYSGDVLESPSLRAIVAALGRLLRNEESGVGPESDLATALDLSKLSAYEAGALRDPESSSASRVVACAVGVGLILKNLEELGDRLARAGISAEQLQTVWVSELENRMRVEAANLMAGDGYEDARRIAEVGTRQLRKSEAKVNVWRLERDDEQVEPASYARNEPPAAPRASEVERKPRASTKMARWQAVAAAAVCAVALGVGANLLLVGGEDPKAVFSSASELAKISLYIESGYRNGHGQGPAFVGTLRPQWDSLTAAEQRELGQAIEKKLLAHGISEFMFFDKRRRLMLQLEKGRLAIH